MAAARGMRLLGLGFLALPHALLVLRDGDVMLLGHLLLLGGSGGLRLGLLPDNGAEADDFVVDHPAHFLDVVDDFEVEVEGCGASGLVGGVVPDVQVGVFEGFLDGNAGGRVEGEHAVEEI